MLIGACNPMLYTRSTSLQAVPLELVSTCGVELCFKGSSVRLAGRALDVPIKEVRKSLKDGKQHNGGVILQVQDGGGGLEEQRALLSGCGDENQLQSCRLGDGINGTHLPIGLVLSTGPGPSTTS